MEIVIFIIIVLMVKVDGKYKIDVREDYTKKKAYEIMNDLRKVFLSEAKDKQ